MATSDGGRDGRTHTSLTIQCEVKDRLEGLKPYQSMSYSELLEDMADQYTNPYAREDNA